MKTTRVIFVIMHNSSKSLMNLLCVGSEASRMAGTFSSIVCTSGARIQWISNRFSFTVSQYFYSVSWSVKNKTVCTTKGKTRTILLILFFVTCTVLFYGLYHTQTSLPSFLVAVACLPSLALIAYVQTKYVLCWSGTLTMIPFRCMLMPGISAAVVSLKRWKIVGAAKIPNWGCFML